MKTSRICLVTLVTLLGVSFSASDSSATRSKEKISPTKSARFQLNWKMKAVGVPRVWRGRILRDLRGMVTHGTSNNEKVVTGSFEGGAVGMIAITNNGAIYGFAGKSKGSDKGTRIEKLAGPGPIRWLVTEMVGGKAKQFVVDRYGKPAQTQKPIPKLVPLKDIISNL